MATGPGDAVADIVAPDDEAVEDAERAAEVHHAGRGWVITRSSSRKAAVEITFEERKYLVVPRAALLVIVREDLPI